MTGARTETAIERVAPADLAMRAVQRRGRVPEQIGALLLLDPGPGFDLSTARRLVADRAAAVPRLRQRIVGLPVGLGPPIWLDAPDFDASRHVDQVACPVPGDPRTLLDTVADLATRPLPESRPQWAVTWLTGLADGRIGILVLLQHTVADGLGGLAVLTRLLDGVPGAPGPAAPRPRPDARRLAADALRSRWRGRSAPAAPERAMRQSLAAAGGIRPPAAAACSLLRRTGPRRRLAVVRADLTALRSAAHREGGTVNDAVLAGVAGALHRLLVARGESVQAFRVAVMVTGRPPGQQPGHRDPTGNRAAPLLVELPAIDPPAERLRRIAGVVRATRRSATGASVPAALGPLFRAAATLGLYRWYLRHQRRIHTVVSNVPGPERPVHLAGAPVSDMIPVAVGQAGDVTVSFFVLSYAGTVAVTVVADADTVPDLPLLRAALQDELDALTARG